MISVELIGFIAGIIIISAHIPQIIKSLKTKTTLGISIWLYVILSIAVTMWTIYGLFNDFVVFVMNGLLLIPMSIMIFLILKYGDGRQPPHFSADKYKGVMMS